MPVVEVVTIVAAPPERVFDCARDVGLHLRSLASTRERVASGRADGLLEDGEEITWEGRHLGLRRRMTVRVTMFERPRWFRDQMVRGPFEVFHHDHYFEEVRGGTRMTDVVTFRAPFGPLGRLAERFVLAPHLHRLVTERNRLLEAEAESRYAHEVAAPRGESAARVDSAPRGNAAARDLDAAREATTQVVVDPSSFRPSDLRMNAAAAPAADAMDTRRHEVCQGRP